MKTSCVNHPPNQRLVMAKEWQVECFDGDVCAAMLLSLFEYWHSIKLEQLEKARYQNRVAKAHGEEGVQDESLLQFHSQDNLERGLLGAYKRTKIRDSMLKIEGLGFISIHSNPNSRYKFDRTRYILFHPGIVNEWILSYRSVKSELSMLENNSPQTENNSPQTENNSPQTENTLSSIYEITPEITSKITEREEEAIDRKALPELEEKPIQDQPIADQSASLSIKQRDSADDGKISGETVFAAAPIFPPQKNNATANYEKRFASPHKYPELKEAGHADIMIGTGYLDFDPIVVEAAVRHLKKHEKPCEVGDAKRFISNRIKQSDWAAIELLKESAATIANDRKKTEAAIAASTNSDEYYDTSRYYVPEPPVIDLEARAKATESGRAKMREALAQARKNRAS